MKLVITTAMLLMSTTVCLSQIKNATTETVKIYGNCGRCEATIEKAGNVKSVAEVDWNKDTKMATLSYDAGKTSKAEILKRIALAGYDSDEFLAPDNVYAQLPGCCQYERVNKTSAAKQEEHSAGHQPAMSSHAHCTPTKTKEDHSAHTQHAMAGVSKVAEQQADQLQAVFNHYFSVKDALVKTHASMASAKAVELLTAIKAVDMSKLSASEHTIWMESMKGLSSDANSISTSTDVSKQRAYFSSLSTKMYELIKTAKQNTPTYYAYCPMFNNGKGAYWLSKENAVENPYYGSQMLSCGSIKETIAEK